MTNDLMKLVEPQWVFRSDTAGNWDVYCYSVGAHPQVIKYSSGEISNPIDAVRALISVMCKTHTDNLEDDDSTSTKPTEADLAAFTEEDINDFSRQFLMNDKSLDAQKELQKAEEQSYAEFFLKVLEAENKKLYLQIGDVNARLDGLRDSKNRGIRSVSEDLLTQNQELESYYGSMPSIRETLPEPIVPPPNPVHETNERLGDMTKRLENLVGFGENALHIMNRLQVASAVFLEDFSKEAEKNSKTATKAIWVGIFAVVISTAQIAYTEFWRVPKDTAAMDTALASVRGEIDDLQAALVADLASLQAAQADAAAVIADSVNSTGGTSAALLQRIDLLLQQQSERDEAIIKALGILSEKDRNLAD